MGFDELITQFEQCYSLDVYKALQDGTATGDENYIASTKRQNEAVCSQFREAGKEGIEYLAGVLFSANIDFQERAACILGRIGRDYQGELDIKTILRARAEVKIENCVSMRIAYALEQLAK